MKKELLTRFMEKRIVELKKEQRNGTAHVYQSTLNRLKNFMNGREITFSQLTPEWLALFEQKLLADQLKWNTISTYMRMLRSPVRFCLMTRSQKSLKKSLKAGSSSILCANRRHRLSVKFMLVTLFL